MLEISDELVVEFGKLHVGSVILGFDKSLDVFQGCIIPGERGCCEMLAYFFLHFCIVVLE